MIVWENVYIFISSTFNDMHAERDYLIKRVFPAVREFCGEHKLNLLDVDLRWGITEEDAAKNKRVVEICLNNLDRCRPFFIGLIGQRRGWVPGPSDISPDTLEQFPGLSQYLGKSSITELELIHGIRNPLADGRERMRHAFLLRRDPSCIEAIRDAEIRAIYEDKAVAPPKRQGLFSRFSRGRAASEQDVPTVEQIFAELEENGDDAVSVHRYRADWNASARTTELSNVGGKDLSAGRLVNFRISGSGEEMMLSDYLIGALREAIRAEFPAHFENRAEETPLQRELSRQETALFHAAGLYIPRPLEEKKVLAYFQEGSNAPFLLAADAGSGKTSLLAHVISSVKADGMPLFYRLAGASAESSSASATIESLCREIAAAGLADAEEIERHRYEILLYFREFLEKTKKEPIRIIIDAVDQWNEFDQDALEWLPETLPNHVRLVISMKTEGSERKRESLAARGISAVSMMPFSGEEDKRQPIRSYLAAFLKDVNEDQIRRLIAMKGSDNPLYLKIILNELRLHGSFDTLFAKLETNYGTTPKDAFGHLINRLWREEFLDAGNSKALTIYFLGVLAYATEPVAFRELSAVLIHTPELKDDLNETQLLDGLYIIARHLSDFLMIDGGSVAFRYDSFRQAFRARGSEDARRMFHRILCLIYVMRSRSRGDQHYRDADRNCLTSILYHGLEVGENHTAPFLADAWFVDRLIRAAGALPAARWYREAERRGCQQFEYGRVAGLLSRYAPRYDIGATLFFYDVFRSAPDLRLTKVLCSKFRKEMKFPFYYPAAESAGDGLAAEKEITLVQKGRFSDYRLFYYENWILHYKSDDHEIVVQSRDTGEVLKKIPLKKDVEHCHAEKEFFHVLYRKEEGVRGAVETFHLPEFSSVFYREDHPELPEGFEWTNFIIGVNGCFYEEADKSGLHAEARMYQVNSGEMVLSTAFSPKSEIYTGGNVSTEFCGNCFSVRYFSVNDREPIHSPDHFSPSQLRLLHIPSRQVFYESEDRLSLGITTDGERLWYLEMDSAKRTRCLVWEETAGGMKPVRDAVLPLSTLDFAAVGAYDGILCLFLKHGRVICFDRNLEPIREIRGCDLVPTERWYQTDYNRLVRLYRGQVTFVYKNRQCYFDRDALEQAGDAHEASVFPESGSYRIWQVMSRDGRLYLFSDVLKKIYLKDLRSGEETDTQMEPFRYILDQVWLVNQFEVVFGSVVRSGKYYIQAVSLLLMQPLLRYGKDLPENGRKVSGVFVTGHRIGAIIEIYVEHDPLTKKAAADYEIQFCDYADGNKLTSCLRLPGRSGIRECPVIVRDGDRICIIRSQLLADESHLGVSVYDVEKKEERILMQYKAEETYHLLDSYTGRPPLFCWEGELYLPMIIPEGPVKRSRNVMFIWDIHTWEQRSYGMPGGRYRGLDEDRIYLQEDGIDVNPASSEGESRRVVHVCSLKDGSVLAVLDLQHKLFCRYVMKKNQDYLVFLENDIMEVFDAVTGVYRYSQYVPSDDIENCPGTDCFYVGDQKRKHAIYRPFFKKD